jgi:hypothetical protein
LIVFSVGAGVSWTGTDTGILIGLTLRIRGMADEIGIEALDFMAGRGRGVESFSFSFTFVLVFRRGAVGRADRTIGDFPSAFCFKYSQE